MNQETSTYLPPEITINILSRLPVQTVITCKLVCKSWLELLETHEFAKSHLSKSVPGLVVYQYDNYIKTFEFEDDELDFERHELHYNQVTKLDRRAFISSPHAAIGIQGSSNGFLFLREINTQPNALYICNPTTHEYIELPNEGFVYRYPTIVTYGFGVSKITGQYKVVNVYHECERDPHTQVLLRIPKSFCRVYTLGTGKWRSVSSSAPLVYNCRSAGPFLNGNLHWLVSDLTGSYFISYFDLEREIFSTFLPPPPLRPSGRLLGGLVNLGGDLCLCDNSSNDEIVIWLMKEYKNEKSWTREFVISKWPADVDGESYDVVHPIKVFKDGDILMSCQCINLFYYSIKTKTLRIIDTLELGDSDTDSMLYTSSFLSLESCFPMENVRLF